jgi:hypothetical protein
MCQIEQASLLRSLRYFDSAGYHRVLCRDVNRLDEKIGVGEAGENNGEYCWPDPCIPDGYGNGRRPIRSTSRGFGTAVR